MDGSRVKGFEKLGLPEWTLFKILLGSAGCCTLPRTNPTADLWHSRQTAASATHSAGRAKLSLGEFTQLQLEPKASSEVLRMW